MTPPDTVRQHRQPARHKTMSFIRLMSIINGAGLLITISWTVNIAYQAGQLSKQLEVDTAKIADMERYGSSGTHERLDMLDTQMKGLRDSIQHLDDKLYEILSYPPRQVIRPAR